MKGIIALSGIAMAGLLFAAPAPKDAKGGEEAKQRRAEQYRVFIERTGGLLVNKDAAKGRIRFVNAQMRIGKEELAKPVGKLSDIFRVNVDLVSGGDAPTIETADRCLMESGANAAIFLVDSPNLPISLVAPESRWAFVNVAKLAEDKPVDLLLAQRVRREMMRTFGLLLGASNSSYPECVMKACFSAREIDAIQGEAISPDPKFKIDDHLKKLGMTQYAVTTYLAACQKGWAPAPTNEFQKAVWDKVHEIPSKPIKIEYNEKRDKGK